ncbi:MAG: ferritin-like domain-containing protein [Myxococcales bacterium]|nr:ferritin-like domain-containing protein [Myxococcales bacterium]
MAEFDFGGDTLDLASPEDRALLRFVLSQALFGEATGVYCGKSLYAAHNLEAARFYLRQARQELAHLELFAEIFRALDMTPQPAHWVIRLLSAHNNYYPLKVLMEHAVGEGMVLDIFRDVLVKTLPDDHPRMAEIKKKLAVVCREEEEHVAWGEKETRRLVTASPWLRHPFYGLLELQLLVAPMVARALGERAATHKVLRHLPRFVEHVRARVWAQGQALGFVPPVRPALPYRVFAMSWGVLLFLRSQFSRSTSTLEKTYIAELGFPS